jgi:pyruvate/2-oxoglutarate dehydrogenase complex dihydrolipoamide acyltransferase (E2) component
MPQMGVSVAEGTLVAWHKRLGDHVDADEVLCEISTDKIDIDVPSPATGCVVEILADVDQTLPVGSVLARIDTAPDGAAGTSPSEPRPTAAEAPVRLAEAAASDSSSRTAEARPVEPPRGRYSPVVRRIAESEGIDLAEVRGTGRGGRVRKQDVLAFVGEAAAQAPAGADAPQRLSRMRRAIAEHMLRSLHTAAHCTSITEVDMSAVEAAREPLGISYLPFVARCVVGALAEHPELNATLDGESVTLHRDVNLGIAVSLDRDGLIVPVIHRAQELSHQGLASRIAELAARARAKELRADDVRGGTFTITNPGVFGTLASTPIINQPQVAILDLEAVVRRPAVVELDGGREAIAIRPIANLCLSWDHRALDGALAAKFLAALRGRLEQWSEG